jgi:large subunit ribosomal protein L9
MKVILRENMDKLGAAGEIVKVADGYARNYLFPRGLAAQATEDNVRQLKHEKHLIFLRQEKAKRVALKLSQEMSSISVTIARQVGEEDRIFGSVTTRDIVDELRKEGYKLNRRQLNMPEVVRKLGVYECEAKLHNEVTATFKVWVVSQ